MFRITPRLPVPALILGAGTLLFTGEIVPDVECAALLTDDGKRVALDHVPAPFRTGDRVTVTGSGWQGLEPGGSSPCQQVTLIVEEVRRAE